MIAGEERDLLARSLEHANRTHAGAALDGALADLGWVDALSVDRRTAVALQFELQGAAGASSSALDRVIASAIGVDDPGVAVVLPPLGRADRSATPFGDSLDVDGLATPAALEAGCLLVATRDRVAEVLPSDLSLRRLAGIDPELGLIEVSGRVVAAPTTAAAWGDAVAAGQVALAHELVGGSRTMLEQAREHALGRIQFDRPISSFQAVRHRLAEAYVAIEAADAAITAAWDDGSPLFAAVAKAVAGRSARTVARHAQQVLAGIGFTAEHPLHLFVKRTFVLDRLLGDSKTLTRQVGEQLLRTRQLPPLLPL